MKKITAALALVSSLFSVECYADPVIIGHNVYNNIFSATSLSLISASTNAGGAVLKTMVIGCNSQIFAYVTSPSGTVVDLLYCVGSGSSAATLPAPVYIPAGWSLALANNSTAIASVNISYDLQ